MPDALTLRRIALVPVALLGSYLMLSCGGDGTTNVDVGDPDPPRATSVSLNKGSISFDALGASERLSATVKDQYGGTISGVALSWTSSDPSVATVSVSGLVTSVGNGPATITAISNSLSATASVSVTQSVAALEIDYGTLVLSAPGDTVSLSASMTDPNGHAVGGQSVQWASSDENVVQIDGNRVVAISYGATLVTATSGTLADTIGVSVAKLLDADSAGTVTVPSEGYVSFYLSGDQDFQINLSVTDLDGQVVEGARVTHGMIGERVLLVIDGPANDPSDYLPTVIFGSPSFLLNASASGVSEGPQSAVVLATAIALGAVLTTGTALFNSGRKLGDGLYKVADFWWDWATTEGHCMTYREVAEYYIGQEEAKTGVFRAALTLATAGLHANFLELTKEFFAHYAAAEMAELFAEFTTEELNLPPGASIDDRVKVRIDLWDMETQSFNAFSLDLMLAVEIDPTDPYCSGQLPEYVQSLPFQNATTLGGQVDIGVQVTSHWRNPVENIGVEFSLLSGNGWFSGKMLEVVQTDANGEASVSWTLPSEEGNYLAYANVTDAEGKPLNGAPVDFSVQVSDNRVEAYFPLSVGRTWTYSFDFYGEIGTLTDQITASTMIGGTEWFRACGTGMYGGGFDENQCDLWAVSGGKAIQAPDEGTLHQAVFLQEPLVVGTTWTVAWTWRGSPRYEWSLTIKSVGAGRTVQGTLYEDVVEVEALPNNSDTSTRTTFFIARGVGIIEFQDDKYNSETGVWEGIGRATLVGWAATPGNFSQTMGKSRQTGVVGQESSRSRELVSPFGRRSTGGRNNR